MLAAHRKDSAVDAVERSARGDGFLHVGYEAFEGWERFKEFVFEVGPFERVGDYVVVAGFAFFFEATDEGFRAFVFEVLRVLFVGDSADSTDFVSACAITMCCGCTASVQPPIVANGFRLYLHPFWVRPVSRALAPYSLLR